MPRDAVGHRDLRRGAVAVDPHVVGDVRMRSSRSRSVRAAARRSSWRWTPVAVAASAAGSLRLERPRACGQQRVDRAGVVGRLRAGASPCGLAAASAAGSRPATAAAAARQGERGEAGEERAAGHLDRDLPIRRAANGAV